MTVVSVCVIENYIFWFVEIISTGVNQMMLPVLSSESFVYHYMLNSLSSEYIHGRIMFRTTAKSIVTTVDYILGRQQGFASDGILMTRKTAK